MRSVHHLHSSRPAANWWEAYPVGNGRLGAMVRGGVAEEQIDLNDDTLWSGQPARDEGNPAHREVVTQLRNAIAAGDHASADSLARLLHGEWTQAYQPLGWLRLRYPRLENANKPADYTRELDLAAAIAVTSFTHSSVRHHREVFASQPADVIVLCLSVDSIGSLDVDLDFGSLQPHKTSALGDNELALCGQVPTHVEPRYGDPALDLWYGHCNDALSFELRLRLLAPGATLDCDGRVLRVRDATQLTILLSAATSYAGFDRPLDPKRPGRITSERLAAACFRTDLLRAEHQSDHRALYERCALELGPTPPSADTAALRSDPSAEQALAALLFHYGRYLLIAASRPGSQPANLQGIWNAAVRPPWNCNYTTNINLQMNYWLAEPTGLPECHQPLFDFIADIAESGARIAANSYGAPGWVLHHNSDLWRVTRPMKGEPMWANWCFGGVWLCAHLWEHYRFSADRAFLRKKAWPLMRGAAEFLLAWLQPRADGRLAPSPSSSPEHRFRMANGTFALCAGSTIDIALADEHLKRCIEAANTLEIDSEFAARCAQARDLLPPLPISPTTGAIQEWPEDWEPEQENHRHASHLYALHPGDAITSDTPELFSAARRALELRGNGGTGWALAWKISFWARLRDGAKAAEVISAFIRPYDRPGYDVNEEGGLYSNLFCAHAPFQIDGNFGFTVGVVELLLQSHGGLLDLLPALPPAWTEGSVRGLRARGGIEVALAWREGRILHAEFLSQHACLVRLRYATIADEIALTPAVPFHWLPPKL